ncbi:MAG: hypothetical protein ACXVBQ_17165, partial [Pseudobdellovibrionaceae bacterium]
MVNILEEGFQRRILLLRKPLLGPIDQQGLSLNQTYFISFEIYSNLMVRQLDMITLGSNFESMPLIYQRREPPNQRALWQTAR